MFLAELARFDNSQNVKMSSGLIAARSVVASIPAVQSLRFVQTAGACWVKHVGSREANSTSRVLLGEGLLFLKIGNNLKEVAGLRVTFRPEHTHKTLW